MTPDALLPKNSNFELERLELVENQLALIVKIPQLCSTCPVCNTVSSKAHSNYIQQLSDVPWAETKVILKTHKILLPKL